jgi:hypothetical protein
MTVLTSAQLRLLARARALHGSEITPAGKGGWENAFDTYNGRLRLWFQGRDNSTRIIEDLVTVVQDPAVTAVAQKGI